MKKEIIELVHPIIRAGIDLQERLQQGGPLQIEQEQSILKGLLLSEADADRFKEFGGQRLDSANSFLGIRYTLVCWLDEIFIRDPRWGGKWSEQKLEVSLYGTNDRAWLFWDQARRAEGLETIDALEVCFLCAMLGFRGDLANDAVRLHEWTGIVRDRILRRQDRAWAPPAERPPPSSVPPLKGLQKMRRAILVMGATLFLMIPLMALYVIFRQLRG